MKFCLFSKNYGALDGCAQSAFDVIISLLESGIELNILYNRRFPDIKNYDGVNIDGLNHFYHDTKLVFNIITSLTDIFSLFE